MRDILYRGKRIDNKTWIEGQHEISRISGMHTIVTLNNAFPVSSHTVNQYVGVVDIKGNKIFEDDIVKTATNRIYQVIWDNSNKHIGFDLLFIMGSDNSFVSTELWENLEVIGNIYDGIYALN